MRSANSTRTALLLIDVQNGLSHPTFFGTGRSTPNLEKNIAKLLAMARAWNQKNYLRTKGTTLQREHDAVESTVNQDSKTIPIIHVHHRSTNPQSPLFPGAKITIPRAISSNDDLGAKDEEVLGTDAMSCAAPLPDEPIMTKTVNSGFIGTDLEKLLRQERVKQLIVVGITTDHCVSTTVRMGANLGVLDEAGDREKGNIVLVGDGCATYGKGGFDGETIHRVNLVSLNEEFADVQTTENVLKEVFGSFDELSRN